MYTYIHTTAFGRSKLLVRVVNLAIHVGLGSTAGAGEESFVHRDTGTMSSILPGRSAASNIARCSKVESFCNGVAHAAR